MTHQQLIVAVEQGTLNKEIEATMGRKMTDAEKLVVDKARAVWKLKRAGRKNAAPDVGSWRAELDRLKCALAEIELSKAEGRLVSGDEVSRIAQEDAAAIKTAMLGMPNALAPQVAGVADVEAVRAILDDWARTTLQAWRDSVSGEAKEGLTP